jgi:glycosyltransferase involved in cell wall biosynthesis
MDITLFAAEPEAVDEVMRQEFEIRPLADYPTCQWDYDLPLYHTGNSRHHTDLYQMSLRYPGLTVLHDVSLYHFLADSTTGQGHAAAYTREVGYVLGLEGINLLWRIRHGQQKHPLADLPFLNRLADTSLGLIVHSQYAQTQIRATNQTVPIQIIPQLMAAQNGRSRRTELPWPSDALIFAALGQIIPAKQPHLLLKTPYARFLFVGEPQPDVDLDGLIAEFNLQDVVYSTGFVEGLAEFGDWISTADVILNLRYPTVGETSATALRAMAAARPLIVFDHGWYSEIPATAALKTPVMDEVALLAAMQRLAYEPQLRQQMGQSAQQTIQQEYLPSHVAEAYRSFITQILTSDLK